MTIEERRAYEAWLKENKVPDYMRKLYNDDRAKIQAAMQKKREAELEKQAAAIAQKKAEEPKPAKGTIYQEAEKKPKAQEKPQEKPKPKPVQKKIVEDNDWEEEEPQLYGKRTPKKKEEKRYEVDSEDVGISAKMSEKTKKFFLMGTILLGAILVVVIMIFLISKARTASNVELAYIQKGVLENNGSGKTYFVRNSETIESTGEGVFVAKIEEGKRVEAGGIIGYITGAENKNIVEKLNALKLQIVALQNAEDSVVTTKELSEANEKIVEQKNLLEKMAESGNFENYDSIVEELSALIAARDEILLTTKSANVNITELQKQKAEYEQIIDKKMKPVTAKSAGIVSYYISGNEAAENAVFTEIQKGNYAEKLDLLNMFTTKENECMEGATVKEGQIVCKVVTDQEYYAIVENSEDGVDALKGVVTLANTEVDYEAAGSVIENNGTLAIISTLRDIKSSMPYEQTTCVFQLSSKSGYTVPITALTDWDKNAKTARIAVVRAKIVKFIYVGVSAFDETNAVITSAPFSSTEVVDEDGNVISESDDSFRIGDCYVVNAKNVKEGQKID